MFNFCCVQYIIWLYQLFGGTNNNCIIFSFISIMLIKICLFLVMAIYGIILSIHLMMVIVPLYFMRFKKYYGMGLFDSQCHKSLIISQLRNSYFLGNSRITSDHNIRLLKLLCIKILPKVDLGFK